MTAPLLTIDEAAARLGLSRTQLWRLRKRYAVAETRAHERVFFRASDIERLKRKRAKSSHFADSRSERQRT